MKKRIVIVLALILTLAFTMSALVGCDEIFKKNEERDAKQIVASVSYGNQTATVTKGELTASFNNYAYYYVYYYSLTYEEAANYIVKSLAQRELLVLFAKEYLTNSYVASGLLPEGSVPELVTLRQLLTRSEYNKAIEETNSDMRSSLKTLVENLYTDAQYNNATTDSTDETPADDATTVKVKFNSQGGSDVDTIDVAVGYKATEPTDPTYDNYTFYGWYTDKACTVKYDFSTKVTAGFTLYAKWVDYRTPRTEMPAAEEVDDYDADDDSESIVEESMFFSTEYIAKLTSKEVDLELDVDIPDDEYAGYINDGIADLKDNLASNYHDYEYYLQNEMKTLIITKLERYISNNVSVGTADVEARFARLVAENKETFAASGSSFATTLKGAIATTYFQKVTVDANNSGYGFVVNILLKMSQDDVDELTALITDGNVPASVVTELRNQKLKAMQVTVSNPDYDSTEKIDYNADGKVDDDDTVVYAMTDPSNPYNDYGTDFVKGSKTPDAKYQKEGGNNYNNILTFGKNADGEYEITYNVSECPSMAYMMQTVPAFTTSSETGIIQQIYNSFEQVKAFVTAGEMTHIESVYWLKEVATAWVYLVGDDTGMTSTDSNNGGLGYMITPDGEDSTYLENFTTLARDLIKKGVGTYSVDGTMTENNFYTFADSFIESRTTSNAYAGIFVLLCSYKAWDDTSYTIVENADGTYSEGAKVTLSADADGSGTMPLDYIVTYGKTLADCVTVRTQITSDLETGMKSDAYNLVANSFGIKYADSIVYNEKVYKSLWKDLD